MFYIRDVDSKKYVKVDSNWHWKFVSKPFATTFKDEEIKKFFFFIFEKEQDKLLYPEYIEDKADWTMKLLVGFCAAIYVLVFLLAMLFIAALRPQQKEEVISLELPFEDADIYSLLEKELPNLIASSAQERIQSSFYSQEDSEKIYRAMLHYAKKYGIPYKVACTLILTESDGKSDAKHSVSNCLGLTQLSLATAQSQYDLNGYARKTLTDLDVLDIETNLDLGFAYYIWCVKQAETISSKYRFGHDAWDLGYLIYNVGYGDVFSFGCRTYLVYKKNPRNGNYYSAMDRWSKKRELCEDLFKDFL